MHNEKRHCQYIFFKYYRMNKSIRKKKSGPRKRKTTITKKRTIRRNKNKSRRFRGGSRSYERGWITSDMVAADEVCPICVERFSETPEKAIYVTACRHLFHNNCLNSACEAHSQMLQGPLGDFEYTCPICRTELENDCEDVWAFQRKALGQKSVNKLLENVKTIYLAQP